MAAFIPIMIPAWLESETFQVEHHPACPSPYKVRLVQYGRGRIDDTESDAIGHGRSLDQAAERARIQRDAVKALAIAKRAGVPVPMSAEPRS
jgi:hypothetical protein